MLLAAIILSVVFTSLGFLVTPGNAKYILSGYNTMSEADRAKMDITSYIRFFRKFHIFLGATLLAGFFIMKLINNNWAGAFIIIYPILAYVFLVAKGSTFYRGTTGQRSATYVIMAILIVITAGVSLQLYSSLQNSELILTANELEIKGIYGLKLNKTDISKVELVPALPPISYKSNGFAAGDFAKGAFVTKDGRSVKLFVNKKTNPFLFITTKTDQIYYSSDAVASQALYDKLRDWSAN
ncbi:DUF3784 domain-containing protein [Dyadobacter sp. CY326]|uniref:DUF3784 domain-containing protein n=1 Tax=Dyadobacter sp. CY326 TaxID=2907300 RepID=UPI001F3FBB96|nr:DUF3784 domain-containing protein [Dyadobacter sp. CY326]MCE7067307.1 DUF3784 domain-containing protein [Dyadobacter sp. CY326]